MAFAEDRLWYWLDAIDEACNRFRPDSETLSAQRTSRRDGGRSARRSSSPSTRRCAPPTLTEGLCDPTVLPALIALGYDRDYDELVASRDDTELGSRCASTGLARSTSTVEAPHGDTGRRRVSSTSARAPRRSSPTSSPTTSPPRAAWSSKSAATSPCEARDPRVRGSSA